MNEDTSKSITKSMSDVTHGIPGSTEELSQVEDFSFRSAYEKTPVMMHSIGTRNELVFVNRRWLEVLGYEKREVLGREPTEFLTDASRRYCEEVARPRFFKNGFSKDISYKMLKRDGDEIDILLSSVAETDKNGEFVRSYAYLVDVEENRASDDLFRQMLLVEERNRMSRNLHETVEHSLIGIMHQADRASQLMDSDPLLARAELTSAKATAKVGLEQARRAVWNLEPLTMASKRLQDVISRGLSRLEDEGMKTSLVVDEVGSHMIDERNSLAVIRIVQEALSNVRLHSRASNVRVWLSYTRSQLMLIITDDGVGFDPSTTHSSTSQTNCGIGLANMRDSARLAGGSVDVQSGFGSGTQIQVCMPFENRYDQGDFLIRGPTDEICPALTKRELEVLMILANGGRNKDIAAELVVSPHTVKFHIENLIKKLDVRTRAELVRVATQYGLLAV